LPERVGAGEQRSGQALARGVEPHRRRARQDANAVARPDRIPVLDALDIMPHAVAVDQPRAGRFGDADHAAIDMFGHAGDHEFRRLAEALRPVLPHQIMIAADAAGGDHHRLRVQAEFADHVARRALAALHIGGFEDDAADAIDHAAPDVERIDTMAKLEDELAALRRLARAAFEWLDDAGPRAPGDMKTRHRIAMAHRVIAAALGPADHRENTVAHGAQPVALLASGEADIGLRPFPRPEILLAIKAGGAHPVLQGKVIGILDAEPALFRRIDQKQPAARPDGRAAGAWLAFLVEKNDALAGVGDLGGRHHPRQSAADHDHVSIASHFILPRNLPGMKPLTFAAVNGKTRLPV